MKSKVGEWAASAVSGVAVLGVLQVFSDWLGFSLPLNTASLTVAAVLGLPGVITLLLLRMLFLMV